MATVRWPPPRQVLVYDLDVSAEAVEVIEAVVKTAKVESTTVLEVKVFYRRL